jgi:hypothetical protein
MKILTEADYLRAHLTVLEKPRKVQQGLSVARRKMASLVRRLILGIGRWADLSLAK